MVAEDFSALSREGGGEVVVAIHQPNYLPWMGFFDKVNKADVLVFLDNVQYNKRSWTNRVQIKTPGGPAWLSIPVKVKGRSTQPLFEAEICYETDWVSRHTETLARNYRRHPFYSQVEEVVVPVFRRRFTFIGELNIELIRGLLQLLGIDRPLFQATRLGVKGAATELLIDITRAVGGTAYLSGDGADGYQEVDLFEKSGIRLYYQHFLHPVYEQRFGEFVPGLSIFDVICCCGVEKVRQWLEESRRQLYSARSKGTGASTNKIVAESLHAGSEPLTEQS